MRNNYGEAVDPVGFGEAIGVCFKKYFVLREEQNKVIINMKLMTP
jgi:hypothetical protein